MLGIRFIPIPSPSHHTSSKFSCPRIPSDRIICAASPVSLSQPRQVSLRGSCPVTDLPGANISLIPHEPWDRPATIDAPAVHQGAIHVGMQMFSHAVATSRAPFWPRSWQRSLTVASRKSRFLERWKGTTASLCGALVSVRNDSLPRSRRCHTAHLARGSTRLLGDLQGDHSYFPVAGQRSRAKMADLGETVDSGGMSAHDRTLPPHWNKIAHHS